MPLTLASTPVEIRTGDRPAPVVGVGDARVCQVIAIVPCYNRPEDARTLLLDLARTTRRWSGGAIDLRVILVDNASAQALSGVPTPPGLDVEHVRLPTNTGGSGGFNAGLARALASVDLAREAGAYVWLVDSDARVDAETLSALVGVLERAPDIAAAGAAIADPETRQVFELGGVVDRRSGQYRACVPGSVGVRGLVECEYVASCCALVRAAAARGVGPMPDRFLNGDDVEWFIRMGQRTRSRIVAVPWAIARHPRFDRFPTWTRYYATRNALGPAWALGLPLKVRLRRTLADVARAVQHTLIGRGDLADLHLRGLKDLANGRTAGPAAYALDAEAGRPVDELEPALRACFDDAAPARRPKVIEACAMLTRLIFGPRRAIGAIPARPGLEHIGLAKTQVIVDGRYAVLRESRGVRDALAAARVGAVGVVHALRAAFRPGEGASTPDVEYLARDAGARWSKTGCTLDVVVLSYNRREALLKTLEALHADAFLSAGRAAERCGMLVVDNASTDGTPEAASARFPGVRVLRLDENLGVEAFNRAVSSCAGDMVLILDDDAMPAPGTLFVAAEALLSTPSLGAVTLLPRHPATGEAEWPFGDDSAQPATNTWPVMGCANLIRRSAWRDVGGYEPSYFLYRNDTDMALKLLGRGWGVRFDPALIAWHDTPAGPGAPKSLRWHALATRNWVWTVRRHGRGVGAALGVVLGWLWAHKAAGTDIAKHRATLGGVIDGLRLRPPAWSTHAARRGSAWKLYLRLRMFGKLR